MAVRTIRNAKAGKLTLRLVETDQSYVGLVHDGSREAFRSSKPSPDEAWDEVHRYLAKLGPNWFGFDGARNRFLYWFASGFDSAAYRNGERDYKVKVKEKLEATCSLEKALTTNGHGEAVLSAFRGTNLLYPVEKTKLQALLRGDHADAFIRAVAEFAAGERSRLKSMAMLAERYDSAKWTVLTYLPFLWRPDAHLFLKPEVTKDFATRVGHPFASLYEPEISLKTYDALLGLGKEIESNFLSLKPKDNIDVQSVIWVTESYQEGREIPQS